MTKAKLSKKKIATVKVKVANTGQLISQPPVTVKNVPPSERLDALLDVNASGEVQGAVPVYDEATGDYIVRPLNISEVSGGSSLDEIDGGTF
jgi:hypothetical protein